MLDFFLRLFYSYLVESLWKERDIQTLDSISGFHNFLPGLPDFLIKKLIF